MKKCIFNYFFPDSIIQWILIYLIIYPSFKSVNRDFIILCDFDI